MPRDQQAGRQPARAIIDCTHGSKMTEPRPTPEKAMLSASPRRTTNHRVRYSDTMNAGVPYTALQRAMPIHPTVSELIPTLLGELQPL